MKVVFRPCCNNCGYEFQELQGITVRETIFEPSHCPKCHEPIEAIVYFSESNGGLIFNYSKSFTDNYVKELEK